MRSNSRPAKAEGREGEDRQPPGVAAARLAALEGLAHFLLLLLSRRSGAAGALRERWRAREPPAYVKVAACTAREQR